MHLSKPLSNVITTSVLYVVMCQQGGEQSNLSSLPSTNSPDSPVTGETTQHQTHSSRCLSAMAVDNSCSFLFSSLFLKKCLHLTINYETEILWLCISSHTLNQSKGKSPQLSFCSHCRLMVFSFGGGQYQHRGILGTSAPCI